MSSRLPWSLDDLRTAAAIARHRTPLRAARAAARAPSSVYRAIDRLEGDVGRPLFERSPAGWRPTATGQELVALSERIEAELAATELRLTGSAGIAPVVIRISASDGFAGWFLAPVLAQFVRDRPQIRIELISDNAFADLAHREADLAVRPDQRPGDDLIGRRAGKLAHALYGADTLLAQYGLPHSLADLQQMPFCALSAELQHFTAAAWARGPAAQELRLIPLVLNTETALAQAVVAGTGIGVLPCFIGRQLAGVSRIRAISVAEPVDIWLVAHRTWRGDPHVGALLRHLTRAFREAAAAFA